MRRPDIVCAQVPPTVLAKHPGLYHGKTVTVVSYRALHQDTSDDEDGALDPQPKQAERKRPADDESTPLFRARSGSDAANYGTLSNGDGDAGAGAAAAAAARSRPPPKLRVFDEDVPAPSSRSGALIAGAADRWAVRRAYQEQRARDSEQGSVSGDGGAFAEEDLAVDDLSASQGDGDGAISDIDVGEDALDLLEAQESEAAAARAALGSEHPVFSIKVTAVESRRVFLDELRDVIALRSHARLIDVVQLTNRCGGRASAAWSTH